MSLEKPLAGTNPMLHFRIRAPSTAVRPPATLFHGLLAEAAIRNGQIWFARECQDEFLPEFIRVQGSNLKDETLRALRYQIEKGEWYRASA